MLTQKLIKLQGLTTDVVIFTIEDEKLQVLLIRRANEPFRNRWALPGGFIFDYEGSQDAALRILKEKAGVKNVYLEQLYTFDSSGRDPRGRVCTVTYFALAPRHKIKFEGGKNVQTPLFSPVKKLPKLAFDHRGIINYAISRLQAKLEYTNAVYSLLPQEFTFNQLQKAYEVIWDRKMDKRNFRKKFLQLGLIQPLNKKYAGTRQRPAQLFRFISRRSVELKKFF